MVKKNEAIVVREESLPATVGAGVLGFLHKQADEFYEPGFLTFKIIRGTANFIIAGQEDTTFSEIKGVILSVELARALWSYGTTEEMAIIDGWTNNRPVCASRNNKGVEGSLTEAITDETPDLVKTLLTPIVGCDYTCRKCPYNEFGSAPSGSGKLCKESRRFLIWNPENEQVGVLAIPPSSIKHWIAYRACLPNKQFSSVVTLFTLDPIKQGKMQWSVVVFHAGGVTTDEIIAPLGKQVVYNGYPLMEAEALVSEFLNLDMTKDTDYDTASNGVIVKGDDF